MGASRIIEVEGAGEVRFRDAVRQYMALKTPAGLGGNVTLELPDADGGPNEILQTNGAGKLSWVAAGAGTIGGAGTANYIPRFTAPLVIGDSLIQDDGTSLGIHTAPGANAVLGMTDSAGEANVLRIDSSLDLGSMINLQQAGDEVGLEINKAGVGGGSLIELVNAGTGNSINIAQNGAGVALEIVQGAAGYAVDIDCNIAGGGGITVAGANATQNLVQIVNSTTAVDGLVVSCGANASQAIRLTAAASHAADVVRIENVGDGKGIHILNTAGVGGQIGLHIEQANDTYGVYIQQTGLQAGAYIHQSSATGHGLWVWHSNAASGSHGIFVNDDGAGRGVFIDKSGTGYGLYINHSATGGYGINLSVTVATTGLRVAHTAAGYASYITGTGANDVCYIEKSVAAGKCLVIVSDQASDLVEITVNGNNADGIYVDVNADSGYGIHVRTDGDPAAALRLDVNGASHGLDIDFDGSGHRSIYVHHNDDSDAVYFYKHGAGAGDVLQLANNGTGFDINGHASNWNVRKGGGAFFAGLRLDQTTEIISGGSITITADQSYIRVDTEGAAASDNLDTISGGTNGQIIVLQAYDAARTVVLRHNVGNLRNTAANPQTLADEWDKATYIYNLQTSTWDMLSFSGN